MVRIKLCDGHTPYVATLKLKKKRKCVAITQICKIYFKVIFARWTNITRQLNERVLFFLPAKDIITVLLYSDPKLKMLCRILEANFFFIMQCMHYSYCS